MSGRRTKTVKRANNAAARELLENHYRSVGLVVESPPKASIDSLSKIIHSGDADAIQKALVGSTKYLKRLSKVAEDPIFYSSSSAPIAVAAAPTKKRVGTRARVNLLKRSKPTKQHKHKNIARHILAKHHPPVQSKCMAECAIKCLKESKFVPVVAAAPVAAVPASTQELRALFSNLSPPRTAPVRQRLRKMGELPEKAYYHQTTNTTRRKGRKGKTIPYR